MREDIKNTNDRDRLIGERIANTLKTFTLSIKESVLFTWGYVNTKMPTVERDFREALTYEIGKQYLAKAYKVGKKDSIKPFDGAVFLCLGCAYADSKAANIGLLVGSKLKEKGHIEGVSIYGTMEDPIYDKESIQRIADIYEKHASSLVIAVAPAESYNKWQVGRIHIAEGATHSGIQVGTKFPHAGSIEVSPILVHRGLHETDTDIRRKIDNIDSETSDKIVDIIASNIHQPLENARKVEILK